MAQNVFERCEKKYLLDARQFRAIAERLADRTRLDNYGQYTIYNLFYDTENFDLIRASIEKPLYKEKFRIRSYGKAEPDSPVYLELKKKYDGIVYKRRAKMPHLEANFFLSEGYKFTQETQILREIAQFLTRYPVSKKVFLSYDRTALCGTQDKALRITFDRNIRFRQTELRLDNGCFGTNILAPGQVLMEIKNTGALPLWLCRALSEAGIFPTSFSKYGVCYRDFILPDLLKREVIASA